MKLVNGMRYSLWHSPTSCGDWESDLLTQVWLGETGRLCVSNAKNLKNKAVAKTVDGVNRYTPRPTAGLR